MIERNENRLEYKKTKAGWIPEEWQAKPLGMFGVFSKGKGISNNEKKQTGYPCVTYGEIYTKYNVIISNFYSFIDHDTAKKSKRIYQGDILFAGSGETLYDIGKCVAIESDEEAYAGGDIIIFMPNGENSVYLSYFLNSEYILKHRRKLGEGYSVVHIYNSGLKTLHVPLPLLPEQKKIAEILSTWDEAIEQTRKLIEAKKLYKKGFMQQLLTGKKRLPQFGASENRQSHRFFDLPADWECPQIKTAAKECSERNRAKEIFTVLSCSKHLGFVESSEYFGKQVFSADTSNYKIIRRSWFGYPSNHIEEGSIGLLRSHDAGIVSPIYTVFECNSEIIPEYLYAVFKTDMFRHIFKISTNSSVNRRGSLRWKEFSLIRIPKPSKKEQREIVSVMQTADKEISLLESKLTTLEKQKRGLMQKLLTGEIRVKT